MRTEKVMVNYSADKLQAIKLLAPDTYNQMENILIEQLDKIYVKAVPLSTRKYIEAKMDSEEASQNKSVK